MLNPADFHLDHLAQEAVVAYVDGELSPAAHLRATAHVTACPQCASDVATQRASKAALRTASQPALPVGLLGRLQQIPQTTELQPPGLTLAAHGEELLWSRSAAPAVTRPVPARPTPSDRRPPGRAVATTAPDNRRRGRSSVRMRRLRRGLLGAMAGLAAGVLATAAAPVAVSGIGAPRTTTTQERVVPDGSTALLTSLDEAMAPRQFSGAATGLR